MKRLSPLLSLSLVSCTGYMHHAGHLADGTNFEKDYLWKLGGSASQRGADGSSIVTDDNASFQAAMQAIGIAYTTWSSASTAAAKYAYDKYQAGQITKQQFQKQMFDLKMYEASAKGTPIEAGGTLMTPNGPVTAPYP